MSVPAAVLALGEGAAVSHTSAALMWALPGFTRRTVELSVRRGSDIRVRGHAGRARFDADLARRNAITALRWRVIHVSWAHLTGRPADVIERLNAVLRA